MNISLIGYGKMGKTIEKIALERGHSVVCKIDIDNQNAFESENFRASDVAIEFTSPATAVANIRKAFEAGVPVVSGTTGWTDKLAEIKKQVETEGYSLLWSSNFSLGMNVFFALNNYLAKIMNKFPSYNVLMEEVHHIHKLDAPSGTAITLAEDIIANVERKKAWVKGDQKSAEEIAIYSIREGEVPGTHSIMYESDFDSIIMTHEAKNRDGLALGAVLAAEFLAGKKGFYTMKDVLKF